MKTTRSNFLRVRSFDIVKGFVVAFLTASLTALMAILDTGILPNIDNAKDLISVGLLAGVGYIIKNVFTNSDGKILKNEPK